MGDDARRFHRQVAGVGTEGTLGVPGTLRRPVPPSRRTDAGGRGLSRDARPF